MARFDVIAVYILANRRNGTIYTGASLDMWARIGQHKSGKGSHFTAKYGCDRLVWYEIHAQVAAAKHRETRLKTWKRQWKVDLIEATNPHWDDLTMTLPFV